MSLSQSFSQKIGNVRPLNPCPSLDIDFANGGYVNTGGFANQESVGSANFKIGAFNGPDPIFTRATAATFRGSNGLIQYAPENLLLRSEEFNDASWSKTNASVTANASVAPNGTMTADLLQVSANSSISGYVRQNTSQTTSSIFAFSCYAKKGTANFLQLVDSAATAGNFDVWFNLDSGVVGTKGSGNTASITNVGNGWYRCAATFPTASTISVNVVDVRVARTDGSNTVVAGDNIYIWGAQLERSSTARPYISTTSAARYGPRFEYDTNGNPLGLLMEEQSQNLLSYSEQFDNVYWSKNNLNTTGTPAWINASIAPNGTTTADKIIHSAGTSSAVIFSGITPSNLTTYTFSVYAKAAENSYIGLTFGGNSMTGAGASGADRVVIFNLSTGGIDVTASQYSPSIVSVGNGWYRCSITGTTDNDGGGLNTSIYDSGPTTFSRTGDGTSGIYIWGAQLEQKPFATSYIPTVGGTMTRNADVVNSTIGSWFNQSEGTIVVSGDRNNNPTLNSSGSDSFFEFTSVGNYLVVHACDGTSEAIYDTNGSSAVASGATIGSFTTVASSYSDVTDLLHISRNGLATQSGASTGLGVTPTTLNIGYAPSNSIGYWNGHIKSFRYFPKALPNNLQRLSS